MKTVSAIILLALTLFTSPSHAALIHYTSDFSPVPGGPPISATLTASLDATWNTDTDLFDNFLITFSQLPVDTLIGNGLLGIGLGGSKYIFSFPQRNTSTSTCCGFYFDNAAQILDFRLDSTFDAFALLSEDPDNAAANGIPEMETARALLSVGFVDFTIYDVFDSASTGLIATDEPVLQALFVQSIIAEDFPDRIPVDVPAPIPVPAAIWLFASALIGMVGFGRRRPGIGDRRESNI